MFIRTPSLPSPACIVPCRGMVHILPRRLFNKVTLKQLRPNHNRAWYLRFSAIGWLYTTSHVVRTGAIHSPYATDAFWIGRSAALEV